MKIINIVVSIAFSVSCISNSFATTVGNYAEIGVALAALSADVAAHVQELNSEDKNAAKGLHNVVDVLSLVRGGLFFYNNAVARKSHGPLCVYNQDWITNTAFIAHDISRLYRRCASSEPEHELGSAAAALATVEQQEFEKKTVELFDWCKALMLPALKGLTAVGIACTQEDATAWGFERFAGKYLRALMQALHSLSRIFEEFTLLKKDSKYRYHMAVAVCVNVAWVVHEFKQYTKFCELYALPAEPAVANATRVGECVICANEDQNLRILHCGHAFCHDCLRTWVHNAYRERRGTASMHLTPCMDSSCRQPMLRGDYENIMRDAGRAESVRVLDAYDDSRFVVRLRAAEVMLNIEEEERRLQAGAKRCPGCRLVIERIYGCDHMTCPCGTQFCMMCGIEWERYPNYNGHRGGYRGHPGIDPRNGGFRCPSGW